MTDKRKIEKLEEVIRVTRALMRGILMSSNGIPKKPYRPIKNTTTQDVYRVACRLQEILRTNYADDSDETYFNYLYKED